jgi:hypothetical protein
MTTNHDQIVAEVPSLLGANAASRRPGIAAAEGFKLPTAGERTGNALDSDMIASEGMQLLCPDRENHSFPDEIYT